MVNKCAYPDCKSRCGNEKVATFLFPKDTVRRNLWISHVPRDNFTPSNNSVLCEKHALSSDMVVKSSKNDPEKMFIPTTLPYPFIRYSRVPKIVYCKFIFQHIVNMNCSVIILIEFQP